MIKNDAGQIALLYFQTVPQTIKINKDYTYVFQVKFNVCMAWVNEEHVPYILGITKVCCGGNKSHPFRYANEMQVRVWSGIAER